MQTKGEDFIAIQPFPVTPQPETFLPYPSTTFPWASRSMWMTWPQPGLSEFLAILTCCNLFLHLSLATTREHRSALPTLTMPLTFQGPCSAALSLVELSNLLNPLLLHYPLSPILSSRNQVKSSF